MAKGMEIQQDLFHTGTSQKRRETLGWASRRFIMCHSTINVSLHLEPPHLILKGIDLPGKLDQDLIHDQG